MRIMRRILTVGVGCFLIFLLSMSVNITASAETLSTREEVHTGWYWNDGWYYYNESGVKMTGWQYLGGSWFYLDGANTQNPGLMVSNTKKVIDGQTYFFGENGAMLTGWVRRPEGWYYANGSGAMLTGWQYVGNAWYYLNAANTEYPGLMVSNTKKVIDGQTYFFNESGAMLTGWIWRSEGWYYANGSGAMLTGWQYVGNAWYYLDGSNTEYPGLMVSNTKKVINGQTYIFNGSGAMLTGWIWRPEGWYYAASGGNLVSGWQYVGNAWYYLDPSNNNIMVSGQWKKLNNNWYYLTESGAMATNWIKLGGNWYYLASDGAMRTGWQNIGGDYYYLYTENDSHGGSHGAMAVSTTIDSYVIDGSGRWKVDGQDMFNRAQGYSSSTPYLILVDRSANRVGIYTGSQGNWSNLYYWECTTGKASTPTIGGVFTVGIRGHHFDTEYGARCYWYTQFRGNYLFHSVLYNKYTGALSDGRLGQNLSHGCVRLDINNAKWIYDNIPSGTTVVVY